jgi:uncharacterized protein YegL
MNMHTRTHNQTDNQRHIKSKPRNGEQLMKRHAMKAIGVAAAAGLSLGSAAAAQEGGCGTGREWTCPGPPIRCGVVQGSAVELVSFQPEAHPQDQPARDTPRIEVVFVLDTTGSMGGLIEGAKAKIWAIANTIATAKPTPEVSMGLVGYRDRSDDYITTRTALTTDLDAIYSDLMAYTAQGGGDTPESVNQALNEAVESFQWSEDHGVLKLIYLVGDAPPHMDYEDDVKYHASCEAAAKKGIIVNTIQCGAMTQTTPIWQEIARLAEGEYFAIDQSGGMTAVATPFDAELGELGAELDGTLIAYGSVEEQARLGQKLRASERIAAEAPAAEALAERAAYKAGDAGKDSLTGRQELVRDITEGKVALDDLDESELPDVMKEMSQEERESYIKEQGAKRESLRARIQELSLKRRDFIQKKLGAEKDSFDQRVLEALRRQAETKGIEYESETAPDGEDAKDKKVAESADK